MAKVFAHIANEADVKLATIQEIKEVHSININIDTLDFIHACLTHTIQSAMNADNNISLEPLGVIKINKKKQLSSNIKRKLKAEYPNLNKNEVRNVTSTRVKKLFKDNKFSFNISN